MKTTSPTPSLAGWDIRHAAKLDWIAWGNQGTAKAKILGDADGYTVAVIRAETGYRTAPHDHAHSEFLYLLDGVVRNQGQVLTAGDAYAAATGSIHTDFAVQSPATYLSIFRL